MKCRNWIESFGHAIRGIGKTVKSERNFRIQLVLGMVAVVACILLRVAPWQFMLVVFAAVLVLVMELVNTAIEALTDLSCKGKIHPLAQKAKDAAAGAVLLASAFAVVVAVVVAVSVIRQFLGDV
jgi:diacylglycerol kinase